MAKQRSVLIVDSELFRHSPLVLHHLVCLSRSLGMQMTIVLTLGLENSHAITRGIPRQTKKQPGSMTLTSHHRRVYIAR